MKALLDGVALADSDSTVVVEGNHYFPPATVRWNHLQPSETTTRCPWKGKASWFHVRTGDVDVDDAAWTYRRPWPFDAEDTFAAGDRVVQLWCYTWADGRGIDVFRVRDGKVAEKLSYVKG